jgi:cupin 2 domain-containing protein
MKISQKNLSNKPFYPVTGENFTEILRHKNVVIERIISSDRPDSMIYNQEQDEWVILLEGKATLELNGESIELNRHDYIFIPSHTPHRVIATSKNCIWLAIHIF